MSIQADSVEQMTYEQAFAELEAVVSALESSSLPLEEAINLFERGQTLSIHCTELLNNAELRIRKINEQQLEDVHED